MALKIQKDEDYDRQLRRGRGLGEGASYSPFTQVHDFSSRGRSSKLPGVLVARTHHLLSDTETRFHPFLESDNTIIDIREQFPVLPRKLCIDVARLLGIRYPTIPRTKVKLVLTIDSLATRMVKNEPDYTAYSIKRSADLRNKRTLEKLEIERACCRVLGFHWLLVTERNFDPVVADNLAWASHPLRGLFKEDYSRWRASHAFSELVGDFRPGTHSLPILVDRISDVSNVDSDFAFDLLRCLIWEKVLKVDLASPIVRTREVTILSISPDSLETLSHGAAG